MSALIECVANFSEGRRRETVASIVREIQNVGGVTVLGWESDADHNRSVVTFVGGVDAIAEAAFSGIRAAANLIDMERHSGQHPRVGAADVIPFVPLRNATMAECIKLARGLGARVGDELDLPVFLYERAALQPGNRDLANIRRGGYEGLRRALNEGGPPLPDCGPRRLGRAGACAIGARGILIAFNVYLSTSDVAVARQIAKSIRASSGGLPGVKALGLRVKGLAQVSMNLTNYKVTSIRQAVVEIRRRARAYGVEIASSEIIGLLPQDALSEADCIEFRVSNFSADRVLEARLRQLP